MDVYINAPALRSNAVIPLSAAQVPTAAIANDLALWGLYVLSPLSRHSMLDP